MQPASNPANAHKQLSSVLGSTRSDLIRSLETHSSSVVASSRDLLNSAQEQIAFIREHLDADRRRALEDHQSTREALACKFNEMLSEIDDIYVTPKSSENHSLGFSDHTSVKNARAQAFRKPRRSITRRAHPKKVRR